VVLEEDERAHRSPPVGLVLASREKPLWQGRRECS
jgi:hypothetical protein